MRWTDDADRGVRLFNARRFFEAHDVFEEIWLARVGDEKTYFQALIQIAAGLYKIDTGKPGGARRLLARGIDKLERTRHLGAPIDHDRLLGDCRRVLDALEATGTGARADIDLPAIRYLDGGSVAE